MGISLNRVSALFFKELKDFSKNWNVSIMIFLPLGFAFIMSKMIGNTAEGSFMVMSMTVGMNLAIVSLFCIAMLIAEEKEKNTLRTLSLSGISPVEFLMGKGIMMFFVATIVNVLIYFMANGKVEFIVHFLLLTSIVNICMIILGALVGIISPNQMSTGVWGMPAMLVLYIAPSLGKLSKSLGAIAKYTPLENLFALLNKIYLGKISEGAIFEVTVILIWILISVLLFMVVYKRKGLDG